MMLNIEARSSISAGVRMMSLLIRPSKLPLFSTVSTRMSCLFLIIVG